MITSTVFDLQNMRKSENRIFEHIGRLTVASAQIDQHLSSLLAWMTGAPNQKEARKIFEGEQVNVKLRLLTRALPDEWPDKKRFKAAVGMVQEYRNKLAHSVTGWKLNVPSGEVSHHLHREYKGGIKEAVDFDELQLWETRAEVLGAGLFVLTKFFLGSHDIIEADLRDLILEFITEPTPEHQAAIDFILPAME